MDHLSQFTIRNNHGTTASNRETMALAASRYATTLTSRRLRLQPRQYYSSRPKTLLREARSVRRQNRTVPLVVGSECKRELLLLPRVLVAALVRPRCCLLALLFGCGIIVQAYLFNFQRCIYYPCSCCLLHLPFQMFRCSVADRWGPG